MNIHSAIESQRCDINVSFLNQYDRLCGIFQIVVVDDMLSKENIASIVSILQTDLNNPFQETGKIHLNVIDNIKEILGESGNVTLDLNIQFYGVEDIEDMLVNDIGGKHKIVVWIKQNNFVDVEEEGSYNKIESIIEENGIIINRL